MSNVINLNKFRKSKQRQDRRVQADENAVKFGQSKTEKSKNISDIEKAKRDLDGHHLSDDDTPTS